jgi:D-beta-D-heptose 7-phosphate kinase/D-beta-D-heptose 1-phosphate adenosyltransferase
VVGADFVVGYGGRVHLAPLRDGFSTTNLIDRMKAA